MQPSSQTVTIELENMADRTFVFAVLGNNIERTETITKAETSGERAFVGNNSFSSGGEIRPDIKQALDRLIQPKPNKKASASKTPPKEKLSLRSWKRKYAKAKTLKEKKKLTDNLALSVFNAIRESR